MARKAKSFTKDMVEIKNINFRMNKEMFVFLKMQSILTEKSVTEIITSCIEKLMKKINNNSLTNKDTNV